ncbi:MAG: hypothetical protein Q9214_001633, partial [Letrouitia sp. 1 TL-2023]
SYLVAMDKERHTMFHGLREHGNLADDRPLLFENLLASPPRSPQSSEPVRLRILTAKLVE